MQQQGEVYPQQPPPQPAYHPQPVPGVGYYILILIGIILLMVSGALYALLQVTGQDVYDIVDMFRILINEVGVGLFAIGMLIGVFKDATLHNYIRMAMVIAMALVLIFIHY